MKLQNLDRGIFERLRLKLVVDGFLPDINTFATAALYKTAMDALRVSLQASGLEIINIQSFGSTYKKGETTSSQFIIRRKRIDPGSYKTFGVRTYEKYNNGSEDVYRKLKFPAGPHTVIYEIRIITSSIVMERLMHNIVFIIFSTLSVFNPVLDNGNLDIDKWVEFRQVNNSNVSSGSDLIEYVYEYSVPDVWLEEMTVEQTNIPLMQTATYTVGAQNI